MSAGYRASESRSSAPRGDFDCCVVGAGPVGLAFALEAADAGLSVLLIDAGTATSGRRDIPRSADGPDIIVDPNRHVPIRQATRRGVGGTSWLWGGRCVGFDAIDFEHRGFVPGSRWPVSIDDITPWATAAADYLDCGAARFRSDVTGWPDLGGIEVSQVERWSRQPKLAGRLGRRVKEHPGITVMLNAPVVDIDVASDRNVRSLVVQHKGKRTHVEANRYVLAMGGLETTRLLLSVQQSRPAMFGGVDGPLGRYYMGHVTGSVADIVFAEPDRAREMDFRRDSDGTYLRRRFTLSEEAQRSEQILNTSFYIDNPPFYAADHRNATLSLVYLALMIPAVGRALLAEGIRLRHIGPRPRKLKVHVANVLRRPWRAAVDVIDVLRRRYLSTVRKPGFILANHNGRYAIHYHGEQVPNPESRLALLQGATVSRLSIDYRFSEQDVDSVLLSHQLLDKQLRAAGIGRIEYLAPTPDGVRASVWEQAIDGFHSIGTTRMSVEATDGVVDANCLVHGTENLYIASSSVFRTAGEANPTFLATCLAVRLAHHIAEKKKDDPRSHAVNLPSFPEVH